MECGRSGRRTAEVLKNGRFASYCREASFCLVKRAEPAKRGDFDDSRDFTGFRGLAKV
jgi:hypothetical protein